MSTVERPVVEMKDEWSEFDDQRWTTGIPLLGEISSEERPAEASEELMLLANPFAYWTPRDEGSNGRGRFARARRRIKLVAKMLPDHPCCHDCKLELHEHGKADVRGTLAKRQGAWTLICRQCNGGTLEPQEGMPPLPDTRNAHLRGMKLPAHERPMFVPAYEL